MFRTWWLQNLDVIISVGYRVKSIRGTQFRIWGNSLQKWFMKGEFSERRWVEDTQ